jgi:hypothetical protein
MRSLGEDVRGGRVRDLILADDNVGWTGEFGGDMGGVIGIYDGEDGDVFGEGGDAGEKIYRRFQRSKELNVNQLVVFEGDTSLAPVRKKLPIEPLRKSNLEAGLDNLDISL